MKHREKCTPFINQETFKTKPNMTKITNELFEDYAMLYPRIECVYHEDENTLITPKEALLLNEDSGFEIEYIQLRSIDSITDEEEMQIYLLEGAGCKFYSDIESLEFKTIDYLRSIGIVTPFRGITVDELIESGKLKLIK